jgi:putative FmdB family regulatory protein
MPIVRTYACAECNHMMDVVLSADDWDAPPPECPMCQQREMRQEFKPVAIGGSVRSRAVALAEDIAAKDYNIADMKPEGKEGHGSKVRYKDQTAGVIPSTWSGAQAMVEQAITIGRDTRLKHGNGLDVLQNALKTGAQPDLIAASKRKAIKVW